MGRSKTRKKNQRSGQPPEDPEPDISETEPSSSDNISTSLNDTIVLGNSNNVMDTDVEDCEQITGNSPADDETDPGISLTGTSFDTNPTSQHAANSTPEDIENSRLNDWTEDPPEEEGQIKSVTVYQATVSCSHVKNSVSLPGLRKALKGEPQLACASKPCTLAKADLEQIGAGDSPQSSNEFWICLQCGSIGCGDQHARGGDAEIHSRKPRSDLHSIVVRFDPEMNQAWCYICEAFIDTQKGPIKDGLQLLKRHPRLKSAFQSKTKTVDAPIIALGPPPPPPQPEVEGVENAQFKPVHGKNKMNNRLKNHRLNSQSSSNWDTANREDWPLGLENLGNTCFMNSALQCLSRTRSLIPKLDLYGTGNTIEIQVTAEPPSVELLGTRSPDTSGDSSSLFQMGSSSEGGLMEENGDSNHMILSPMEPETGSTSPSSEMDSLLDVASAASSKSSPSKDLSPETYKEEIEKELKKSLRLNLVVQKESMTSRLRNAFKAMTRSPEGQPGASGSFGSTEFFVRGRHVYTPTAIHNAMCKHFRMGQQHDSHELLRTVVDMMKKDQIKAFRLAIMQTYGIKKTEGKTCDPKVAELLKMWDRKLYHKTFVDEIFGGELVTFQTCLTCGAVRRSYEDFLDLSLPIRLHTKQHQFSRRSYSIFDDDGDSRRSVEDCLKSFTEPEQLTGSNAVECEKCHRTNLERLAAGASFEEVFPGLKPPDSSENKKKPVEPSYETEMDASEPLLVEEESPQGFGNVAEDMDDLDEPAVDGILGNTSDMEDEGNDVPPVFLGDAEDKQISTADYINSSEIPNKETMSLSLAGTQDEGFSESDSSEEKKSASISASSSRNSISEAENGAASAQKTKETNKPIPITKCPCSRRQMVFRPPECLTIHLKRFQITSHGTSKLSDRVNFPYILNLTPFCAREEEDLERLGEDGKAVYDEDGEVKYALYGIVEHSGSLHWGHYVAYIKVHGTSSSSNGDSNGGISSTSNGEVTPDKWFYISDSSVSPSSLDSVLGMDPYILFYERIRGQDKKEKLSQLDRLNNPSCSTEISEATAATSASATFNNDTSAAVTTALD